MGVFTSPQLGGLEGMGVFTSPQLGGLEGGFFLKDSFKLFAQQLGLCNEVA